MASGIFETLKRAIIRKNYNKVEDIQEKVSLLYAGEKISAEEYFELMELIWKGGDE